MRKGEIFMINVNITEMDLCDECKKYNEGKEKNEIRYCMQCSKKIGSVYIPQQKKSLADYLYDVMVENGMTEISCINKDILIEASKRSNSVVRRFDGSYFAIVMHSLRARDLFENTGKHFFPGVGRYYVVYKIREQ